MYTNGSWSPTIKKKKHRKCIWSQLTSFRRHSHASALKNSFVWFIYQQGFAVQPRLVLNLWSVCFYIFKSGASTPGLAIVYINRNVFLFFIFSFWKLISYQMLLLLKVSWIHWFWSWKRGVFRGYIFIQMIVNQEQRGNSTDGPCSAVRLRYHLGTHDLGWSSNFKCQYFYCVSPPPQR